MFEKGKIYISKTDSRNRIWLWKCSKDGYDTAYEHRLLISSTKSLDYVYGRNNPHHGWTNNKLATPEEANWLEQCILNHKLHGQNLKDIPQLKQEINYEIY